MLHLVTTGSQDFLADLIIIDMVHHALCVKVCELYGKSFESMALWNVVLNCCLEFIIGKGLP